MLFSKGMKFESIRNLFSDSDDYLITIRLKMADDQVYDDLFRQIETEAQRIAGVRGTTSEGEQINVIMGLQNEYSNRMSAALAETVAEMSLETLQKMLDELKKQTTPYTQSQPIEIPKRHYSRDSPPM